MEEVSVPCNKETPVSDSVVVCRGCLADSGNMKNIIEWGLADDFYSLTRIEISQTDGVSKLLCVTCVNTLCTFKAFKIQCQKNDLLLRSTAERRICIEDDTVDEIQSNENKVACTLYDNELVITIIAPNTKEKILLPCPYQCSSTFIKKNDLHLHLTRSHQIPHNFKTTLRYHCSFQTCSYYINSGMKFFSNRKFLNQHCNKVHKSKTFGCIECDLKFATDSELRRHVNNCNVIFKCEKCDKIYKTRERLLVHLMRKHPYLHKQYKEDRKAGKRKADEITDAKKLKIELDKYSEYICDSPKRSFATQTSTLANIKNDVTLPSWLPNRNDNYETKTDEISTQTVFEDLISLKSQTSEDESIFYSETVSLSDIQTQTFPIEFGLSRSNKETLTSETQSPDLKIKETQTCYCLYDSPKLNYKLFDSISSSPSSISLTSTETQTAEFKSSVTSDVLLNFNSAETQTCFDESL